MKHLSRFAIAGACLIALASNVSIAADELAGNGLFEHVTLAYQGDAASTCPSDSGAGIAQRSFWRLFPSGARSAMRFVVPAGKQLVVTDVSWTAPYFATGTRPVTGESALLKLAIHTPNGAHRVVAFVSTPVVVTTQNQSAKLGTTEHMTAGFRVGAGRILCASISNLAAGFDAGTLDPESIYVNGYLVAE